MAKLQRGAALTPLRQGLGLFGEDPIEGWFVPQTVVPVALVDLPQEGRDVEVRSYNGVAVQTGVAGQVSQIQLFNPAESGVIVRVKAFNIVTELSGSMLLHTTSVALATLVTGDQGSMDFRTPGVGSAQLRTQATVIGAVPGFLKQLALYDPVPRFDPNGWLEAARNYHMTPGSGILIFNNTVNSDLTIGWSWEEFNLTPASS